MSERIAIVGLACEYPDASTPEQLWGNVVSQRRSFRPIPRERLGEGYFGDDDDLTYARYAAVLADYAFDRVAHNVSGATYRSTDLTQWLALDVAGRALTDVGTEVTDRVARERTGVIFGNSLGGEFSRAGTLRLRWPYVRAALGRALADRDLTGRQRRDVIAALEQEFKAPFPELSSDSLAGGLSNVIAGRICNHFDFHGGGYTVDGACASSLLAVVQGAEALRRGDLDLAVVGGVDLSLDPFELVGFSRTAAISPGPMKVYDTGSAGFWPGEGCGVAVLMRESDARRTGARVRALLGGWGVSSDGAGGTTRPERRGQLLALQRAYAAAGWDPASVALFEGHGTGTPVGDATELAALLELRGEAPDAAVGSVKANIGHTKAAAGLAGLIKTVQALEHRILPPVTGCPTPVRALSDPATSLRVLREPVVAADGPMRAGVSAMGFGGINTHLALAADPERSSGRTLTGVVPPRARQGQDVELLVFSADDPAGLLVEVEAVRASAGHLSTGEISDLAVQQAARPLREHRAAVVVSGAHELAEQLGRLVDRLAASGRGERTVDRVLDVAAGIFVGAQTAEPPRVGLVFPGQAAPSVGSAGAAGRRFPGVGRYHFEDSWSGARATEVAQPAIMTSALAGLEVLAALGIEGAFAVGHSLGEIGALHWAGVLPAAAAIELATTRGAAMAEHCAARPGGMCELRADATEVDELIHGLPVVVAAHNGADRLVVAGDLAAVEHVVERARRRGVTAVQLRVSHAFHSPLMAPAVEPFRRVLAGLDLAPAERPAYSTVTGREVGSPGEVTEALVAQLEEPVLFHQTLVAAGEADLYVEVGSGRVFGDLAADATGVPTVSLEIGSESSRGFLTAAGAALALGVDVHLAALAHGRRVSEGDPLRRPTFLVNPCEALGPDPLNGLDVAGPEADAVVPSDPQQDAEPVDSSQASGDPAPETATETEQEAEQDVAANPLALLTSLVARRTELPEASVVPESTLVGDLGLNSLTVAELVAEAASALGVRGGLSTGEVVGASVAEVAEMLASLGSDDPGETIPGAGDWVRSFRSTWRPVEPRSLPAPWQGTIRLVEPGGADPALANLVRETVPTSADAATVVVVGPHRRTPEAGTALLAALRSVLDTGAERLVVLHRGDSAGPLKCLAYEEPDLATVSVAVPDETPAAAATWRRLLGWRLNRGDLRIGADGSVQQHDLVLRDRAPAASAPLGPEDVVLVTGGGKGLGAECAITVAETFGAAVALVGRSSADDAEVAATRDRLAERGVRHLYLSADVTDAAALSGVVDTVRARLGRVTALVHAAGVNEPGSLRSLNDTQVARCLTTKTTPVRVLAETLGDDLRTVVAMGSIIGRIGLHGEAHYALANEWLSADLADLAAERPGLVAHALEWSVWSGAGMGERLSVLDSLARLGVTPVPLPAGLHALVTALGSTSDATPQVIASRYGDAPPMLPDPRRGLPILRFLETPRALTPQVELVCDATLGWDTDPYLAEHTLDGRGVLPAVVLLEAVAQCVQGLTGIVPTAYAGLSLDTPVVVPADESVTIRIAALRLEEETVRVVVRSSATGFAVDHVTVEAQLSAPPALPDETAPAAPPARAAAPGRVPPELYEVLLFHGPRFQRIRGFGEVHAARMRAEVAAETATGWFSSFLPDTLVLGDPGARDAFIHAAQATIPLRRFVPQAAERIEVLATLSGELSVRVTQREHAGDALVVDLDVVDASGRPVERWVGLTLRAVTDTPRPEVWSPQLVGPRLERALEELGADVADLAVALASAAETAGDLTGARALALERAGATGKSRHHRVDGAPELVGQGVVSVAHSDHTVVVAASRDGRIAVDVEPVRARGADAWRAILGSGRYAAAETLVGRGEHALDVAATMTWAAVECLHKSGASRDAPLVVERVGADGVAWRSGELAVATVCTRVVGENADVVLAVLGTTGAVAPSSPAVREPVGVTA